MITRILFSFITEHKSTARIMAAVDIMLGALALVCNGSRPGPAHGTLPASQRRLLIGYIDRPAIGLSCKRRFLVSMSKIASQWVDA